MTGLPVFVSFPLVLPTFHFSLLVYFCFTSAFPPRYWSFIKMQRRQGPAITGSRLRSNRRRDANFRSASRLGECVPFPAGPFWPQNDPPWANYDAAFSFSPCPHPTHLEPHLQTTPSAIFMLKRVLINFSRSPQTAHSEYAEARDRFGNISSV